MHLRRIECHFLYKSKARRQKLALAVETEEAKRTDEEFKALKNFSGVMLGGGLENGGNKEHRKKPNGVDGPHQETLPAFKPLACKQLR